MTGERAVVLPSGVLGALTGRPSLASKPLLLQFFFLIVPSCYSFILDVYLLGEVDAFIPIPLIFSFVPHLLFVSLTFPWT